MLSTNILKNDPSNDPISLIYTYNQDYDNALTYRSNKLVK